MGSGWGDLTKNGLSWFALGWAGLSSASYDYLQYIAKYKIIFYVLYSLLKANILHDHIYFNKSRDLRQERQLL